MSFRPTFRQAIGRGSYLGGLLGITVAAVLLVLVVADATGWLGAPAPIVPLLPLAPIVLGVVVGALAGPVFCRYEGADIDDAGIRCVPRRAGGHTSWRRIDDLRAERRGGRTRVAVYVRSGQIGWLRAPYSGRFLATDPEFERKLFMLRNVLATHRSFALAHRARPARRDRNG